MKRKIIFILIFLIALTIFACGNVNAANSYINTTVTKGSGKFQNDPNPNQITESGIRGFYCINYGRVFNSFTIKVQKNYSINKNGALSIALQSGSLSATSRVNLSEQQAYRLSYLFGENLESQQSRQYAIWRVKGNDATNWKNQEGENVYYKSGAYYNYVKSGAKVRLNVDNAKLTKVGTYNYYGPIYFTFTTASNGNYTYKPTFTSLAVSSDGKTYYNAKLYNASYDVVALNSVVKGTAYYIRVTNTNASEYFFRLKYKDIYSGWLAACDSANASSNQAALAGYFTMPEKTVEVTGEQNTIQIELNKVNGDKEPIGDKAVFEVSVFQYNGSKYTYLTSENGELLNKFTYNVNGTVSFKVTPTLRTSGTNYRTYVVFREIEAPVGYKKLDKPIIIVYAFGATGWNSSNSSSYAVFFKEEYESYIGNIEKLKELMKNKFGLEQSNWPKWTYTNAYNITGNNGGAWTAPHSFSGSGKKGKTDYEVEREDVGKTNLMTYYIFNYPDIPKINLNIKKLNYNNDQLNGAEFTIKAMQSGKEIFNQTKADNSNVEITPLNRDNVYVMIQETKAPAGYSKIKEPICIIYNYNIGSNNTINWEPTFSPTFGNWCDSGFVVESIYNSVFSSWVNSLEVSSSIKTKIKKDYDELTNKNINSIEEFIATENNEIAKLKNMELVKNWYTYINENASASNCFGKWKINEENDTNNTVVPNLYYSSSGDNIIEDENGIIKVYDKPVLEKITLLKTDKFDVNNLVDAKFSVKFTNIKSFKYNNTTYNITDGYKFEDILVNTNGIEITDVDLINPLNNIEIEIEETREPDNTIEYYYKKLDGKIIINLQWTANKLTGTASYTGNDEANINLTINGYTATVEVPNERVLDISGIVWLDRQSGIKETTPPDGIKGDLEKGIEGVIVYLYKASNELVATTVTDNDGKYEFRELAYDANGYYVVFEYDGINYESTITEPGGSKAVEDSSIRQAFNNKFYSITQDYAIDKETGKTTSLSYSSEVTKNGISKLITTAEKQINGKTYEVVMDNFAITANTAIIKTTSKSLNYGLIARGTDLALATDVANAKVTINGKEEQYSYNVMTNTMEIGTEDVPTTGAYNLNIWGSDYNYRIRDYVSNNNMKHVENTGTQGEQYTGDELKVFVTYRVDLQNQNNKKAYIKELEYIHDPKYTFNQALTTQYNEANNGVTQITVSQDNNIMAIDLNTLELGELQTKTLYLVFEVDLNDLRQSNETNFTFVNNVEIKTYATDEGFIDVDSAPGNCKKGIHEDDCSFAKSLNVLINQNSRIISGYVEDKDNLAKVNGVIVQLIELKEFNGQIFEYIWQETVSGYNGYKKMSIDGNSLEVTDFTKNEGKDGYYSFAGYIPGNYIIRYIYGDGSVYDYKTSDNQNKTITIYDNVHNGQDYKSAIDKNYKEEWYDASKYNDGDYVARDNEARRLETMAKYVEFDASKAIELKLLNNTSVDSLNEVEKDILKGILGKEEIADNDLKILLNSVLANTWMCAETSKLAVGVDQNATFNDMNLGLEKRPETRITLEKHITAFKVTASNGQTLVNAYLDENGNVEGIRDNLTASPISWKFELSQTDINTLIDGAKLEFTYTITVKNESERDFVSSTLANEYNNGTIEGYVNVLNSGVNSVKLKLKANGYNSSIGEYLGEHYYTGNNSGQAVRTEVTKIRDYVNNNLQYMSGTTVNPIGEVSHYVLDDTYALQKARIKTVLDSRETSGKLGKDESTSKYEITLGMNTLSSTGVLDFDTYIAEVMSFTNAAGRRTIDATPGNARTVDKAIERDESIAEKIQIGSETGEDMQKGYTWLVSIAAGLAVIAVGVYATKKYIIK